MTRQWEEKQLGDVITLQRGFDLPERDRLVGSVPIVSSSGITGYHTKSKVRAPGVVTGRYGTLGEVFYIDTDFWPLNTTLWVKDFKGNDPLYVCYLLRTLNLGLQNAAGAVPGVNRNALHMLPVRIPPHWAQEKMASVLSSYDNLIETNTRRIEILEQMAQMLYREWFVHFRFPGHEKVRTVESELGLIPEGWTVRNVEAAVKRVPSGKRFDQKTTAKSGLVPVLDQGKSGIIGYHNEEPGVEASPDDPIIVFANHTCYQRLVMFSFSAIQNVLPFRSSDEFPRDIYWLHWATRDLVKFNDYKGHWPEFMSKRLIIPSPNICSEFGNTIKSFVHAVHILERKNGNLRETRDLLLPKLVSGEIRVEEVGSEAAAQTV